ncbi:MAG: hypothetical protein IPM18_06090 [Phycisphaerales bacterium]|nr:hypothetical protein [Phycisphaerales bacterium]
MGAVLESLLALQDIELQIVDIRRQLAGRERAVSRQRDKVKEAEVALASEREDLMHAQVQWDQVNVSLKAREADLAKLRDNLNSVRTNKEYAAILSQLNTEKADKTRLETRGYELMEEVEAKKKAHAEHQEGLKQEKARLDNLQIQYEQAAGSFRSRLDALEQRRAEATEHLDPQTLQLFERLSERYDGEAMAKVEQAHPRRQEYSCGGCFMSLAAERVNALLSRGDVVCCDACGRILHMPRN